MNARVESPAPRARSGRHACGAPHRARWGRVSRAVSRVDWVTVTALVAVGFGLAGLILTAFSMLLVAAIAAVTAVWMLVWAEHAPEPLAQYRYPGGDQ